MHHSTTSPYYVFWATSRDQNLDEYLTDLLMNHSHKPERSSLWNSDLSVVTLSKPEMWKTCIPCGKIYLFRWINLHKIKHWNLTCFFIHIKKLVLWTNYNLGAIFLQLKYTCNLSYSRSRTKLKSTYSKLCSVIIVHIYFTQIWANRPQNWLEIKWSTFNISPNVSPTRRRMFIL